MATIKPVSFNRLPEIDENDGKVILHDGSQLGRSTKELGEIIDDRLHTGLEDGKQYAMTTSGWKDVVIPEVDLTPYAYSAGLEADKQFVMTDNGWTEVDLSPYALSADVNSKAEEISAWANETFLTGVDLSDYALSADVEAALETKADAIARVGGGGPLFGENMKFRFAPEGGTNLNLQEYDSSIDEWTDIGVIVTKENKGPNKILKTNNINVLQWIDPDYYTKSETSAASEISAALEGKEDKIFVAEYNVTTYADIKAAYDAGKQIFLLAQNFNEYAPEGWSPYTFKVPLTDFYSLGDDTWFKFSFFNDSAIVRKITVVIKNNNVWSVYYNTLQDELSAGTDLKIVDNVISVTGAYVPLSATQCTIGIGNTNTNQGISFTQGFSNTVQNDNAFAQGTSNTVSQQSMAQGIANSAYNNSFAQGGGAYANTFSFAQGNGITANNTAMVQGRNSYSDTESLAVGENVSAVSYSLAVGNGNSAFQGSIAVGLNNTAKNNGIAQGYQNSAFGEYSIAIGLQNRATSNCTFATGRENSAAGEDAIAMGQKNYASSRYTFAVGLGNSAIEGHAIALGQNNIVSGEFGVALSQLNSAFGDNSFVAGYKSCAKGRYADAIGFQNSAIGEYSFVAGCTSKAYTGAISIGTYNDASGAYSVAIGHGVSAKQNDQTVLGKYNEISNDASDLLIVGNGLDSSHTSNAFVIKATGVASATNMMTTAGYVVVSADVTAADTQYAMTTSGWQPVSNAEPETVNLVPGTGIVFRDGTGADEGKTFVEVDSTNYKLLTIAEYNSLTAVIDTVSTYSASWVLTNN